MVEDRELRITKKRYNIVIRCQDWEEVQQKKQRTKKNREQKAESSEKNRKAIERDYRNDYRF